MKTATLIKENLEGFAGEASLYKVNPPMEDWEENMHKYVICSTVYSMCTGLETCIFPANKKGKIVSFEDLEGSERGTSSHKKVFKNVGYKLKKLRQ